MNDQNSAAPAPINSPAGKPLGEDERARYVIQERELVRVQGAMAELRTESAKVQNVLVKTLDVLKACGEQFALYAEQHAAKAAVFESSGVHDEAAKSREKAEVNTKFVVDIQEMVQTAALTLAAAPAAPRRME